MTIYSRIVALTVLFALPYFGHASERDAFIFPHQQLLLDGDISEVSKLVTSDSTNVMAFIRHKYSLLETPTFGWSRPVESTSGSLLMLAVDVTQRRYFDTFFTFSMATGSPVVSELFVYGANIENPSRALVDLDGDTMPEFVASIDINRSFEQDRLKIFKNIGGIWANRTAQLLPSCISSGYCKTP